jgi:hypothetical protein
VAATAQRKYIVTEAMMLARSWHRRQMPTYRVEEVAKFFFGMSASWLRLKLNPDKEHPETWFVIDGHRMEFRRREGKSNTARVFWLSDIEKMAYSLKDFGAIDSARLARVLNVVEAEAELYGMFDAVDEPVPAGA